MLRYIIIFLISSSCIASAKADESSQLEEIQRQITYLQKKQRSLASDIEAEQYLREHDKRLHAEKLTTQLIPPGFVLFLSATFCSLWAQYTRRSSILWFALGFLVAPIALFVLLYMSSSDLNKGRMKPWN